MSRPEREKTAFVLTGGASLGAVQVGMLRALYEREIRPDLVVGASVGAINASFIAERPATAATIDALANLWAGIDRRDIFPLGVGSFLGLLGRRPALVARDGLEGLIRRHARVRNIEDADTPLRVVATDVMSGIEVVLSRGDLVSALVASAAIPGVFAPVLRDGVYLADGSASNNTPISVAVAGGASTVYILPTGNACALKAPPGNPLESALHAWSLIRVRQLNREVKEHLDQAEIIVLPPPCPLSVSPMDFSRSAELMRRGYEDSASYLANLEAGRERAPIRLVMHHHHPP